MGAHSDDDGEPVEENEDGCPGGWYRCTFVWSLGRYLRPSNGEGLYSEAVALSRSDDRLVLDAVNYFELEQARWRSWAHDQRKKK